MSSVGLVLGAGGMTGSAYSTGVLAALADVAGWDARDAGVIVGTSAGAGLGATLRAGIAPADHYARNRNLPLSPEAQTLVDRQPPLEVGERQRVDGIPIPASPLMIAEGVLGRWPPRPGLAISGAFPRGTVSTESIGARIRAVHPSPWPVEPLWICSIRLKNGERVVFGRDDIDVPDLGAAVEASSAIPGWFAPVRIGGEDYVDGGGHSSTNADVAAGLGFDVVIVIAPMAGSGDPIGDSSRGPLQTLRSFSSTKKAGRALSRGFLAQEVAKVRAKGSKTLVFEPTARDIEVLGNNGMDGSRARAVAEAGYQSAATQLERDGDNVLRHLT